MTKPFKTLIEEATEKRSVENMLNRKLEHLDSAITKKHGLVNALQVDAYIQGAALPNELLVMALESINKVSNDMGLDIKMVEYETVWCDPNNIKKTLELTQEVRIKEFTKLRETLNEIISKLEEASK